MTGARGRLPSRIALRIYLVTVATLLTTGAAVILVLRIASEPRIHYPFLDLARYTAAQLAERWPSEAALRAEVDRLAAEARFSAAVFRWDGAPLVPGARAAPPLSAEERAALAARGFAERQEGCEGTRPCAVVVAIARGGAPLGYAVVAPPPPDGPEPPPRPPLELLPVVMLVAVGAAAVLLGNSIAHPLDRIARTARALGAGDLSARTGVARRDELGAVARAFDEMAERVVVLLRGQTELIANVAHELRTPLARIRVALDLAADGDAGVARASLSEISEDLAELERLVADVLASARMDLAGHTTRASGLPQLHRAAVDVGALVAGCAERLEGRHPGRRVELEIAPGLPPVEGDPALLRRALDNLLDNARKYSAAGSAVRVRASLAGAGVVLEVIDQGEGISPADLERLFTPFFRADRSRARATGGVGLGLALSRRIVEAHGGTLVARSAPGEGTTLALSLPAAPGAAP